MNEQIYLINSMLSIILIAICMMVDSTYISSKKKEDTKINIQINLSNPYHYIILIISLTIIIYVKYLTILIAFIYSGWIIIQIVKFKNKK